MENLEKFKAWIDKLPGWCRWIFAFLLALALIGASIYYTAFQPRVPTAGPVRPSVPGRSDIDRKVDHDAGIVDHLVQDDLPAMERNRQAMEARATDLLVESERLIAESRSGKDSAPTGK